MLVARIFLFLFLFLNLQNSILKESWTDLEEPEKRSSSQSSLGYFIPNRVAYIDTAVDSMDTVFREKVHKSSL